MRILCRGLKIRLRDYLIKKEFFISFFFNRYNFATFFFFFHSSALRLHLLQLIGASDFFVVMYCFNRSNRKEEEMVKRTFFRFVCTYIKLTGNVLSFLYCFGIPMASRTSRKKKNSTNVSPALFKVIIKSRTSFLC
jgi:hypothetical protein